METGAYFSQALAGNKRRRGGDDDDDKKERFGGTQAAFGKRARINYPNDIRAILVALVRQRLIDTVPHNDLITSGLLAGIEARAIPCGAQGMEAEPIIFEGAPIVNIIRNIAEQRFDQQSINNACWSVYQQVFTLPEDQARTIMLDQAMIPFMQRAENSYEGVIVGYAQMLLLTEMLAAEAARQGLVERAMAIIEWTFGILNSCSVNRWIQSKGGWVQALQNLRS